MVDEGLNWQLWVKFRKVWICCVIVHVHKICIFKLSMAVFGKTMVESREMVGGVAEFGLV